MDIQDDDFNTDLYNFSDINNDFNDDWCPMQFDNSEYLLNFDNLSNLDSCSSAVSQDSSDKNVLVEEIHQNKKLKKSKKKVTLTPSATQFKKRLYKILTNGQKNIVRKEFVFFCHSILHEKYNIRNVVRDEYRSIGNYFNSFANDQNVILNAIRELKSQGMIRIQL